MSWFYLIIAGLFEVGWAVGMKYSQGFSKPLASVLTIILMILSVVFLAQAIKNIPLGTAYAIWTGIGAIGTVLAGLILFDEPRTFLRLFFVFLIFIGIVGLKLVTRH